jgi:hypothetical protein
LYRRLGGPQGRSGQVRKISPPTGIRSPSRPSRSQSLYWLSYPAHTSLTTALEKNKSTSRDCDESSVSIGFTSVCWCVWPL